MTNVSLPARRLALHGLSLVCVAALALGAVGCGANSKKASPTVNLKFRPTSQMKMGTFAGEIPDTTVNVGPVTDARDNKDQIGENVEEKTPVAVFAASDPTEFVGQTLKDLLSRAGLKLNDNKDQADRVLAADLHRFWTQESNTYEAEVRATVTVNDKGGRQLWKGTINGTAERFGKSLSPENYQEVFSDAMVNMVQDLLNNPGFRASLKKDAKPANP
jgi:hypothetical protein